MCPCYSCQNQPRRSSFFGRAFSLIASVVISYAAVLFVSGTLINTGAPLAVEVGKLIQTVTFVEPTITWADSNDMPTIAKGVRLLSGGLPINEVV